MKNMRKKRGWFREGPALTSPSSAFMRFHAEYLISTFLKVAMFVPVKKKDFFD